jgi:hypothetical protein
MWAGFPQSTVLGHQVLAVGSRSSDRQMDRWSREKGLSSASYPYRSSRGVNLTRSPRQIDACEAHRSIHSPWLNASSRSSEARSEVFRSFSTRGPTEYPDGLKNQRFCREGPLWGAMRAFLDRPPPSRSEAPHSARAGGLRWQLPI